MVDIPRIDKKLADKIIKEIRDTCQINNKHQCGAYLDSYCPMDTCKTTHLLTAIAIRDIIRSDDKDVMEES